MGLVHLGFDPVLERYVAVKQITRNVLEHPENVTLLAYFEREAKVVASLQHPNIIQIYEYGNPPGDSAYIVTEFVDGITFEELMEDLGGVPGPQAMALLHPVADALDFAHERGIIHRDLKPGNVMLSRHGRVFLMDFGLAKPMAQSGLKSMIIGSPAFMAPEQVEGLATDIRTDVFAFGLLAFALASGQLFFSATAAKAFVQIIEGDYPDPQRLAAIADPEIRAIVERCTQRDPADRYQTMLPIVEELERALARRRIGSAGREVRRLSGVWSEFMPQQFTPGPGAPSHSDTTPANARFWTPTMERRLKHEEAGAAPFEFGPDMDASDTLDSQPEGAGKPRKRGAMATPTVITGLPVGEGLLQATEEMLSVAEAIEIPSEPVDPVPAPANVAIEVDNEPHRDEPPVQVEAASEEDRAGEEDKASEEDKTSAVDELPLYKPDIDEASGIVENAVAALLERVRPTRASDLTVMDGPPAELEPLRAVCDDHSDPDEARRILLLIAANGGRATFGDLRALLNASAPEADLGLVSATLAHLVNASALIQDGEAALMLGEAAPAGAIFALVDGLPILSTVLRPVVAGLLNEAIDAQQRFDLPGQEQALERASALVEMGSLPEAMRLDVRLRSAELAAEKGEGARARDLFSEALASSPEDSHEAHRARFGLAGAFIAQNRLGRAMTHIDEGIASARSANDARWAGRYHRLRAEVRSLRGELRAALVDFRKALQEETGPEARADRALIQLGMGHAQLASGRYTESLASLGRARDTFEDQGDVVGAARALVCEARVRLALGDLDPAEDLCMQARSGAKASGVRQVLSETLLVLGEVQRLQDDLDGAEQSVRRALVEAQATRLPVPTGRAKAALALILSETGDNERAASLAEEAWEALPEEPIERVEVALVQARVAARAGDLGRAAGAARTACELAEARGAANPFAWLVRGRVCEAAGDSEAARDALDRADAAYAGLPTDTRRQLDEEDVQRFLSSS